MRRRDFVRNSTLAGVGGLVAANSIFGSPTILTKPRVPKSTEQGTIVFKPYIVQKGSGPHYGMVKSLDSLGEKDWKFPQWAFASDENWDAFYSNIFAYPDGVKISNSEGRDKIGINVRWNVEGFGFIYMTADNGGEFYELPSIGNEKQYNLNFELAKSRLVKNRERYNQFMKEGYFPEKDVKSYLDLSEEYFHDAQRVSADEWKRAQLSQKSLYYSMWGGEMLELDKARKDIVLRGHRPDFFIGCDTKGYPHMDKDYFLDMFSDIFNYATITHYLPRFEKEEGKYTYLDRDEQFSELRKRGVTVEGRPIFWSADCCMPDWIMKKSYPELLKYLERHTREVVSHYGDEMYAWEIINEAHDPGNPLKLTPDQMVEIAKLIADVAKDTNPNVHRLINNCCLQADYVQLMDWSTVPERYDIITPHRFIKMCHEAGVDFDITGQQLYFQYTNRDLADNIRMTERLKKYGRPIQITEIGTTAGPTKESIMSGEVGLPELPYPWHRHWDDELQAEWMDQIYTIFYAKDWVEAINWYDFVDPYSFIDNGGFLKSPAGPARPIYDRLKNMQKYWKSL